MGIVDVYDVRVISPDRTEDDAMSNKSTISIRTGDITELETDAIVNAANDGLAPGGGVCGAIFYKAGYDELNEACRKIGGCPTGNAVITPGFRLKARYVIHAVGPVWMGGDYGEAEKLYGAYYQSLLRAKENDLHSIGFPLISSGIFNYPKEKAWERAFTACSDFINEYPDYQIDIVFVVLGTEMKELGEKIKVEVIN